VTNSAVASIRLLPRRALLLVVRAYRLLLKPWIGNVCRFEPSCSEYAMQALQHHGAAVGSALAAGRILRCHPWCDGGLDPVPEHLHLPGRGLFTRLQSRQVAAPAQDLVAVAPPQTRKLTRPT
jgi:putative membrane protein insertion efficiency factor